jgi:hypothetical protein
VTADHGKRDSRQHGEEFAMDSERRKGFLAHVPGDVEGISDREPLEDALRTPSWERDVPQAKRRERAQPERLRSGNARPFRGSPQRLARTRDRRGDTHHDGRNGKGRPSLLPAAVAVFVAAVAARRMTDR